MNEETKKTIDSWFKPTITLKYNLPFSNLFKMPHDPYIFLEMNKYNDLLFAYRHCCKDFTIFNLNKHIMSIIESYIKYPMLDYLSIKYYWLRQYYDLLYELQENNSLILPTLLYKCRIEIANKIISETIKYH